MNAASDPRSETEDGRLVEIGVDLANTSRLERIWRFFGYDEPNYSYTRDGLALLRKIGSLPDGPYHVRTHFLFCSGDGTGRAKWGSTNLFGVDAAGKPTFDWAVWDRIFDAHLQSGCLPFVELGFMPQPLSSAPRGIPYDDIREGAWRFPPKDYDLWAALIAEVARHCLDRYGSRSVSRWYWELWNEPDIFYWAGTADEYFHLFDVTEAALHSIIPYARLGGPATTNPANETARRFLEAFLDHCLTGTNYVSGARGTRLDFASFHAKGGHFTREPDAAKRTPTIETLLANVDAGLETIRSREALRGIEVILSECDPDGWAAGTRSDNPNLAYRNTEYYASYLAMTACRLLGLDDRQGIRVDGLLTWAFEFEGRELFAGLRALSTNGIDKPVLGALRLLSQLAGRRAQVDVGPLGKTAGGGSAAGVSIAGIATVAGDGEIQILLVSHCDDWDVSSSTRARVTVRGAGTGGIRRLEAVIVDAERSNAYAAWKAMGEPAAPSAEQRSRLEEAARLQRLERRVECAAGRCSFELEMRPHSVHLLTLSPA